MITRWAKLTRGKSGPDGTPGKLVTDTGWTCATIERAEDGEHQRQLPGEYPCTFFPHEREGDCYQLEDRHGRTAILIHAANVFEQLLGCIAPGEAVTTFEPGSIKPGVPTRRMAGVNGSKPTLHAFEAVMECKPFTLIIE